MKKRILIIGGDPNSVNSELIYKCWKQLPKNYKKKNIHYFKLRFTEKTT